MEEYWNPMVPELSVSDFNNSLSFYRDLLGFKVRNQRENPDFAGHFLPVYGEPYSKRHDFYHRLDIRAERKTDWFGLDGKLIFEIMNAYNQENIADIDLDYDKVTATSGVILEEESDDFVMRPSIGYSFKF